MIIYLARNGRTFWNHRQRLQGFWDVPLNCVGRQQCRRLTPWYRIRSVERIVSSTLLRARPTARIPAERAGTSPLTGGRLPEIDHGPWTGLRLALIESSFPDDFATRNFFPGKLRNSDAESPSTAYRSCTALLRDIINENPREDFPIVSHGVTSALLLCAAIGASFSRMRESSSHNTAVSALTVQQRPIVAIERELHATAG